MRVIGIGDNVVDRYINKGIMYPGGNAVNFAVYAAQCGEQASYLGLIADDEEGRLVRSSLTAAGVDVSRSPLRKGLVTERCDVTLRDGDRIFQGVSYGRGEYRTLRLSADDVEYLSSFDLIHCGCYAEMAEEMAKLADVPAIRTYDFSEEEEYRSESYLERVCPYIDIALFSAAETGTDPVRISTLRDKVIGLGSGLVLITDGARGQTLWDGRREYKGRVKMVEAVDTMRAGDSFFTAFVIALLRSGYSRGKDVSAEMAEGAFDYAADFSAATCLKEGAFGFGRSFKK